SISQSRGVTQPVYTIKAAPRLTGVPADTLRRWESRYQVITPRRTQRGYRLYSQRDVDTILWLKGKLAEGLSISRACEMLGHLGGDPTNILTPARGARSLAGPAGAPAELGIRRFEALAAGLMGGFWSGCGGRG